MATTCSYCYEPVDLVWATPLMADVSLGANACAVCWESIRQRGIGVEGIDVGEFPESLALDLAAKKERESRGSNA